MSGHDIHIPTVDPKIAHKGSVTTPEWMISIDDLLSSTIEDYEQYCELLGWYAEQARITKGNTANQLFASATVQHSNIIVIVPNGTFGPTLENKMNTGSNLSEVTISRLANMGEMKVLLQEIKFTNCKIETIQQQLDKLVLTLRPETRENTVYQYDQSGQKEGQTVSKFDYTTSKSDE